MALGGFVSRVMWSFDLGFMIRPQAVLGDIGNPDGRTAGNELQAGFAIAYADTSRRLAVGPELLLATALSGNAFKGSYSSVEALFGAHYNIAGQVQIGVGAGVGLLRQPGTPDGRLLFRVTYVPMGRSTPVDRDHDGIPDVHDLCPSEPRGDHPDHNRLGCPLYDRDSDGVSDPEDLCPDEGMGKRADASRPGCPLRDRDSDGLFDSEDLCPDEGMGKRADASRPGCPLRDRDGDGVFDPEDLCPDVVKGEQADLNKPGCPLPDRDKDSVPDPSDACPDEPGVPSLRVHKNGCPGLVAVRDGQIVLSRPIFFATNKDVILKKSFPVLRSVADVLNASARIKTVCVEGHTDDRGEAARNVELSSRRAHAVQGWLVEHGVAQQRLEAQGYGPQRPVASNKRSSDRAKNRRVGFVIVDANQEHAQAKTPDQVEPPPAIKNADNKGPVSGDQAGPGRSHHHHRRHHHGDKAARASASPI